MEQSALVAFVAFIVLALVAPLHAQATADETLGGGSDIPNGSVLELTSGATIGPVHHVFADNPGTTPIEVEFRAETPPGIEITPELERFTLQPDTSTTDHFSITVDPTLPPGDYDVSVQLVRSDITSEPGTVTNIPAVGTSFTIRVVGASASITVEATSIESDRPVDGTLMLTALPEDEPAFEVGRFEGSTFTQTVAPGSYRASYMLDGRELDSRDAQVAVDEDLTIRLEVNTVSFVRVAAEPVLEDGRVVVSELIASIDNHLRPITTGVTIQAAVYRDGEQIDTVVLPHPGSLPAGVTEATRTYRPDAGFDPGDYRFEFELVTDEFTLQATTQPTFTVDEPSASLTTVIYIAVAAAALGAAVLTGTTLIKRSRTRRRRKRQQRTAAPAPMPPPQQPTTAPTPPNAWPPPDPSSGPRHPG